MTIQDDLLSFRKHLNAPAALFVCMGDTLTHLPDRSVTEGMGIVRFERMIGNSSPEPDGHDRPEWVGSASWPPALREGLRWSARPGCGDRRFFGGSYLLVIHRVGARHGAVHSRYKAADALE